MERRGARIVVEKRTVIDEGTEFKGSLTSSHPVLARGRIEGDLSGPALEVASTGVVVGKAKVTELHSSGELSGTFEAEEAMLAGRVRDGTVIVAEAVEVAGENAEIPLVLEDCELRIGHPPSVDEVLRAALRGA
jgi:cytoskeletal protein CcmA (bactofilin family)